MALVGRLSQYRTIAARDVARAMVRAGAAPHPDTHVYHWRKIVELVEVADDAFPPARRANHHHA